MSLNLPDAHQLTRDDQTDLIITTLQKTIQNLREVNEPWAKIAQCDLEDILESLHRYDDQQIDALCRIRFGIDRPSAEELGQARSMMEAWIVYAQRILQGDTDPELARHACSLSFWLSTGQYKSRREKNIKLREEFFL